MFRPHFSFAGSVRPKPLTAVQVAKAYSFPDGTGEGVTIGIIELGGGYVRSDIDAYSKLLGIPSLKLTDVSVDGATNSPGSDADAEVVLDIEICGAVAPAADIRVYFAPNTDEGFLNAIEKASDECQVISISWGGPEDSWTSQSRNAMNAALERAAAKGIPVFVAAGDSGSSDGDTDGGRHVDFPASSIYATACGGTRLEIAANGATTETVWNDGANGGATGGGYSSFVLRPEYQSKLNPLPRYRGLPDVTGNGDPDSGYVVILNGQESVIGGTSAVAPLYAGLAALLIQAGKNLASLNHKLYNAPASCFHDVVKGNNADGASGFSAKSGWDACAGLGSIHGTALLAALLPPVPAVSDELPLAA